MRIHLFTHTYPIPYKPYYDAQFADLVGRGHDITIFAGNSNAETLNEKVTWFRLAERTRYFPTTLRTVPRQAGELLNSLFRDPAEVLRAVRIAKEWRERGTNRVTELARMLSVSGETPDLCLVHGLGTAIYFRWLHDLYPAVPIAMYYHGGEVPSVQRWSDRAVYQAFERVDIVFTNTGFSAANAVERGCPADKIVILPVGFDLSDFQPSSTRSYRARGSLRLLSAGRMSEEKGFIFALQAIKLLVSRGIHDIQYALTGDGYRRPALEKFVREHGLGPYVTFLGTLSTEGVIRAMEETDALVLSSIRVGDWVENQACAVQEAMLMKALVVTTQTGGVPESIPDEMRPFSAAPRDPHGLAGAIARIHALPVDELRRLGDVGREFVIGKYDVRSLNTQMIERIVAAGPIHRFRSIQSAVAERDG